MSTSKAIIKLLSSEAQLPKKGSEGAAGYDLYSIEETIINPRGRALIKTGIAVSVPPGTYGRIAPRSGLALKSGIDVGAGVIDYDYRGEVGVLLFNFGDTDFKVGKGERIAQLIFEKIESPVLIVDELDETNRGASGYGSSGVN